MANNLLKAYRGDEPCLFISYAHKDSADVMPAIEALAAKGFRVWYDEGIEAGEDWSRAIGTSLEKASQVLFFASKSSVKSENVRREITFAKEHDIPVLTVQLGRVALPAELQRLLLVNQTVDLAAFPTYGAFADSVAPVLKRSGAQAAAETSAQDAVLSRKVSFAAKKKRTKTVAIIVVVLAILAAIVFALLRFFFADVPNVVGLPAGEAQQKVADAGFGCNLSLNYSDEYEYGVVFAQSAQGRTLKLVPVVVTQSLGPEENLTDVPDTVGRHVSEGAQLLVAAGMTKFSISPKIDEQTDPAQITAQSIPAGLRVSRKNAIDLTVATDGGEIEFEIGGRSYTISGTGTVTIDAADPDNILVEDEAGNEIEGEKAPDPRMLEAVAYLKAKYGTSLFDDVSEGATVGLLRQVLMTCYGQSRAYVYAQAEDTYEPVEGEYAIPWGWDDDYHLPWGPAAYVAVKSYDRSIVENPALWEDPDNDVDHLYPPMLEAIHYAERRGAMDEFYEVLEQDEHEYDGISIGSLAVLFANIDRMFEGAQPSGGEGQGTAEGPQGNTGEGQQANAGGEGAETGEQTGEGQNVEPDDAQTGETTEPDNEQTGEDGEEGDEPEEESEDPTVTQGTNGVIVEAANEAQLIRALAFEEPVEEIRITKDLTLNHDARILFDGDKLEVFRNAVFTIDNGVTLTIGSGGCVGVGWYSYDGDTLGWDNKPNAKVVNNGTIVIANGGHTDGDLAQNNGYIHILSGGTGVVCTHNYGTVEVDGGGIYITTQGGDAYNEGTLRVASGAWAASRYGTTFHNSGNIILDGEFYAGCVHYGGEDHVWFDNSGSVTGSGTIWLYGIEPPEGLAEPLDDVPALQAAVQSATGMPVLLDEDGSIGAKMDGPRYP